MSRTAHPVALELEPAWLFSGEYEHDLALPALRNDERRIRAGDVKPVGGVFAREPELDGLADADRNLRGPEGKSLRAHPHHSPPLRRGQR